MKISARDGGTNPKYATAQVKITIEDENDESPRFLQGTAGLLILEISENTRVGSKITSVQAVDNDQGRNGSVSYSLSRATQARYPGVFSINSGSGDITVNTVMFIILVVAGRGGVVGVCGDLEDVGPRARLAARQHEHRVPRRSARRLVEQQREEEDAPNPR